MMAQFPFSPSTGAQLAVSATSSSTALDPTKNCVRLYNMGPKTVFFRWGLGAQTATVLDLPIGPGSTEVYTKNANDTLAAICNPGEVSTLSVMSGEGL